MKQNHYLLQRFSLQRKLFTLTNFSASNLLSISILFTVFILLNFFCPVEVSLGGIHFGSISASKTKIHEIKKSKTNTSSEPTGPISPNHSPEITSLTAIPSSITNASGTSTLTCFALDTDGDFLDYSWNANAGSISGSGYQVTWTAPLFQGTYMITVTINDGKGGSNQATVNIPVTSGWKIEIVTSVGDTGADCSIALDLNNRSHISYRSCCNVNGYSDLKYTRWDGSQWVKTDGTPGFETVDANENKGYYTSIVLGPYNKARRYPTGSNYPHVSYFGLGILGGGLYYANWNGTSWSINFVDLYGTRSSIAIDSNNNPHIAYYDSTNHVLKYAKWTGASWSTQTVDSAGYVGNYNSIALDINNNPHISYYDWTNEHLKVAVWSGLWVIMTVDSVGGRYTSIAVGSDNHWHVAYLGDGDLKYVEGQASSWWPPQTVDTAVARDISIALDSDNRPHISYFATSYALKYAKWTGSSWSIQAIDSDDFYLYPTSIALDSNNSPHISYSSYNNLKYAKWVP